jgi:cyclopropane fatty-acyl-phospholipid synthase-like methyltransferase
MIPHPDVNIWEHTRETLFDLYARRARNELPEMTCHRQAVDLLAPHIRPGFKVLDAGCGSGYLYWSFVHRGLDVEYHGIDYTESFIRIGRENLPPQARADENVRQESIEEASGRYDAVVCINTLFCLPDYRQGLERLCRAAGEFLVLRTALDRENVVRYETDDYLDPGWRDLMAYFNIWSLDEVSAFIEDQGFAVRRVVDERTGDKPEISAGKLFPWKFLFARRTEDAR